MRGDNVSKYSNIRINYNVWMSFEDGHEVMEELQWHLLICIMEEGSIMAAAKRCSISYRKAWGDLRKAEGILGFALIDKQRGGKAGGQTELTEEGHKLISAYREFSEEFKSAVNNSIINFKKKLKNKFDE